MLLKHTAEVFEVAVEAISEKYGLDIEELSATITSHPKYKDLYVNPVLHDVGYLPEEKPKKKRFKIKKPVGHTED